MLERETFAGELMDGQSAGIRPVQVTLEIGNLRVADAGDGRTLVLWPLAATRVDVLGGGAFHIRYDGTPDALLTTGERALVERMAAAAGKRPPAELGGRGKRILKYGAGVVVALTALYLALPGISAMIARRIPIEVEEKIGLQLTPLLVKARCQTPAADQAMAHLVQRLEAARPTGFQVEVWVMDASMVNAFALPGGRVVVTRGLLDKAEGPDEVAGVVAHELAHVAERHVMTHVVRASVMSFLWAATIGDFSGLFVIDPSVAMQIAGRQFGRAQEHDADLRALAQLDAARISRRGFAAFFERIQEMTDIVPAILSTHPASADRIRDINAGAPAGPTTPALSAEQWKALKNACPAAEKP